MSVVSPCIVTLVGSVGSVAVQSRSVGRRCWRLRVAGGDGEEAGGRRGSYNMMNSTMQRENMYVKYQT
jgi:hypothetical protein